MIALERVWRLNKLSLTALWVLLKNPVATIVLVTVSTPGDFRTGVGLPTMGQSQGQPSTGADGRMVCGTHTPNHQAHKDPETAPPLPGGDTCRSQRLKTSTIIRQASIRNYDSDVIRHPTNFITYLFTGLLI